MAVISEIAPNIFRISIFAQLGNLQFNHYFPSIPMSKAMTVNEPGCFSSG